MNSTLFFSESMYIYTVRIQWVSIIAELTLYVQQKISWLCLISFMFKKLPIYHDTNMRSF